MKIFQNKIVVGVICIVIAAILAFFFLPSISKSKSNTEKIYVVKNAVAEGTQIDESMLTEKEVGSYGLPQSIIKDKDKIVGKYATCDITPDDLIISSMLFSSCTFTMNIQVYTVILHLYLMICAGKMKTVNMSLRV